MFNKAQAATIQRLVSSLFSEVTNRITLATTTKAATCNIIKSDILLTNSFGGLNFITATRNKNVNKTCKTTKYLY